MTTWFKGPLTGRHVLYWFLGFFAVVFIANGIFLYFAGTTWTGLETQDAYRKGLDYNRQLEAARAQKALGWSVDLSFDAGEGATHRLSASFLTAEGEPVYGLSVRATLRRPVTVGMDQEISLESMGGGRYSGVVELPQPGLWDIEIHAEAATGQTFAVEKRFTIQ